MRSIVLLALSLIACASEEVKPHGEPALPDASGSLIIGAGVNPASWSTLEMRFASTPIQPSEQEFRLSFSASSLAFPFDYSIGGDLGITTWRQWKLTAWLTNATDVPDAPAAGEPADAIVLTFACDATCPNQTGIGLELR